MAMLLILSINIRMTYTRSNDTRIPEIHPRIHRLLEAEHLTGQEEYKFQPENVNMPAGWATLTFDIVDPTLDNKLNGVISNLEWITGSQSD